MPSGKDAARRFGILAMLAMDWFGLLLLNSDGAVRQMGLLNVPRVTAILMSEVAIKECRRGVALKG
jgi:hypothetical protein